VAFNGMLEIVSEVLKFCEAKLGHRALQVLTPEHINLTITLFLNDSVSSNSKIIPLRLPA